MQKRKLGEQGLEVSEIGFGCVTMTGGYGQSPDRTPSRSVVGSASRGIHPRSGAASRATTQVSLGDALGAQAAIPAIEQSSPWQILIRFVSRLRS